MGQGNVGLQSVGNEAMGHEVLGQTKKAHSAHLRESSSKGEFMSGGHVVSSATANVEKCKSLVVNLLEGLEVPRCSGLFSAAEGLNPRCGSLRKEDFGNGFDVDLRLSEEGSQRSTACVELAGDREALTEQG
ncbi:hypothetical protein Salat_1641800 [Sesamum alatum]|uniref:Uncharacterized protein n=1 Tax=Sesamum alatum TaxID=300844 RepID=A0AAE1Y6X1_9LAMI|nr:hypothetical protein Salat_1641800 [Sesamum alatum]